MLRILSLMLLSLSLNAALDVNLVSKEVDTLRKLHDLPALSITVQLNRHTAPICVASGFVSIKKKRRATCDSLFEVGSITKTFTAVVIMKLLEQKKLKLSDKLSKWLPEYPKWSDITIRQLLNHTSGVFNYINSPNFWEQLKAHPKMQFTLPTLAKLAYKQKNRFLPGTGYSYTNTDYILLGMVAEKASNRGIKALYQKIILKNLQNTYYKPYPWSSPFSKRVVHGYDREGTFGAYNTDVTNVNTSFASSAGAIVSTSKDINLFIQSLFSGTFITPSTLKIMQELVSIKTGAPIQQAVTDAPIPTGQSWNTIGQGLGMGLVSMQNIGNVWMHAGGMPGYQSLYLYSEKQGMSISLVYSAQPKKPFVFMKIAQAMIHLIT